MGPRLVGQGMTLRRSGRAVGAGLLLAAALGGTTPARGADTPLEGYKGLATAVVLRVYPSFPALTIADPPAQVDAPHTTVTISTGNAGFARSSILWPGDILAHMGSLLAQAAPPEAPEVPNYPVRAEAQSPGGKSHMEGAAGLAVMDALADGPLAEATGTLAGAGVEGGLVAKSSSSTSRAEFKGTTVVVTATSTIEGVSIAGGIVTADAITTVATATSDGIKGTGGGVTTVTGLEVNGIPASIDSEGIHAADNDADVPNPDKQISDGLAAAGIRIQLASPVDSTEGAGINRVAAGLLIRLPLPETVAQVNGAAVTIALASANAAANGSVGSAGVGGDVLGGDTTSARSDDLSLPPEPSVDSDIFDGTAGFDLPTDDSAAAPAAVVPRADISQPLAFDATDAAYTYGGISWLALLVVVGLALFGAGWVRRWLDPFILTRSSS